MSPLAFLEQADPACGSHDPELWFPPGGVNDERQAALNICGGCPVRADCLQYALDNPVLGIWGGSNEKQRTEIARASGRTYDPRYQPRDVGLPIKPESMRRRELRELAEKAGAA